MDLSNENILHVKNADVEYIQFKRLLEFPQLVHAFTLSVNEFDIGSNETSKRLESYKKLANSLKIDYNKIIRPYQTHTDIVKRVDNEVEEITIFPQELTNVDGLITNKENIFFSLGYADCIPLFFYDPIKNVIGNIHSGWKGTLQKIGQKAVSKMIEEYNCDVKDIICCIGPSIRKCHFELEDDVYQLFYNEFSYINRIDDIIRKGAIVEGKRKYNIDIVLINKIILQEIGIQERNIVDSRICTACNSNIIHSYRVSGKEAGRNTAIIGLTSL